MYLKFLDFLALATEGAFEPEEPFFFLLRLLSLGAGRQGRPPL